MTTAPRLHRYTYAEDLRTLSDSGIKLEFWGGEIYAMAGGIREHGALASKIMALIDAQLPAGCRTFSSDVKVRIETRDATFFPDGSVVCGKVDAPAGDRESIVNPGLIVEVTSPSTEDCDRREKLEQYQQLPSLHAVWIVSHREPRVTVVERAGSAWRTTERRAGERLVLAAPALTVDVDTIYRALDGL